MMPSVALRGFLSLLAITSEGHLDFSWAESVGCQVGTVFPGGQAQCIELEVSSFLAECMHSLLLFLQPQSLSLSTQNRIR